MYCLLWNNRVVIPSSLRQNLLDDLLCEIHPGINNIEMITRGIMWSPNIEKDLEEFVKRCGIYESVQSSVPAAQLQQWMWRSNSWERAHLSLAEKA